jgi:hypothetical protein
VYIRMSTEVHNKRLTRDRVGRAEIGDLASSSRDGGARGDAIISAVIKTGEYVVEVSALIGHQLPYVAEYPGNALHQRNVKTSWAIIGQQLEGRVGERRSHFQIWRGPGDTAQRLSDLFGTPPRKNI